MITSEYDIDQQTAANDAYMFINHMLQAGMITLTDIEKNW